MVATTHGVVTIYVILHRIHFSLVVHQLNVCHKRIIRCQLITKTRESIKAIMGLSEIISRKQKCYEKKQTTLLKIFKRL